MYINALNAVDVVKISIPDFIGLVAPMTGSNTASLIYTVDDQRSRTVKGAKLVQKRVFVKDGKLCHNYTKKVKVLTGNDDFVAQERKGKSPFMLPDGEESKTLLVSDKTGEVMISAKTLRTNASEVLAYLHNGKVITEAEAVASDLWAPAYYDPKPKTTAGRGTVDPDDDFFFVEPYLIRCERIKINGTVYELEK